MNVALLLMLAAVGELFDFSHLDYAIPPGAQKVGPDSAMRGRGEILRFFQPGEDISEKSLVANEIVVNGQLKERNLFRRGKTHGVQATWHPNGRLASSSPYKDGIRHGVFEQWDMDGQLVARYWMLSGCGTARVYDSDGLLVEETSYLNNKRNGWRIIRAVSNHWTMVKSKHGRRVEVAYSFYLSGDIAGMSHFTDDDLDGPYLEFNLDGVAPMFRWFIGDQEVTDKTYQAAIKDGLELPPYLEDPQEYVRRIPKDIWMTVDRLKNERPVRVPLVLGDGGLPIEAH